MFSNQQHQVSISTAAKKLKVSTRSVQRACHRWNIGTRISVGIADKVVIMLNADELKFLNQHLQRRSGRPSNEPNKNRKVKSHSHTR